MGLILCLATRLWAGTVMAGGFSAWVVPWDVAESSAGLECFDEARPFAFALSSGPALSLPYTDFLQAEAGRRRAGAPFIPVVVNDVFAGGKLKSLKSIAALTALLSDPARVAGHVTELAGLARKYDGLEVDYERVPPFLWNRFARFIERLAEAVHKDGKTLYVDLEPRLFYQDGWLRDYAPRLAHSADGIDLMAYYERGGLALHPGAGSSLPWVLETARRALQVIPQEKLVVALSLAGTEWSPVLPGPVSAWRGKRLLYGQVQERLSLDQADIRWDDASACPFYRAAVQGRAHEVWFENERSLAEKIRALRGLGVTRIGFWYWGRSHPDLNTLSLCPH